MPSGMSQKYPWKKNVSSCFNKLNAQVCSHFKLLFILFKVYTFVLDNDIAENREQIAELNAIIAKQPCTLEEFEAKKQDITVLKHNLQLQKEKVQKWIEIITDCDYKLTDTKQKVFILLSCKNFYIYFAFQLDRAILDQNLTVMKWEHIKPEMKNLEIQITGYAQIQNVRCYFKF